MEILIPTAVVISVPGAHETNSSKMKNKTTLDQMCLGNVHERSQLSWEVLAICAPHQGVLTLKWTNIAPEYCWHLYHDRFPMLTKSD